MHCSRRPARPGGTRSSCRTSGARLERERARRIETIARQRDEAGGLADWEAEREAIAELIASWDVPHEQIAVAVPTNRMVTETASRLSGHGIPALEIGPDGPRGDDGVHIGTMFRFKGLEYQHMIIAGASDGLVPRAKIQRRRETDPGRFRRDLQQARSLLFVAATRARDTLDVFWHGEPSSFLPVLRTGNGKTAQVAGGAARP